MTLKEYLKTHNLKADEFAKSAGFSSGGVLKWLSGERFPRSVALKKIYEVTNGAVTPNDFWSQQIRGDKDQG